MKILMVLVVAVASLLLAGCDDEASLHQQVQANAVVWGT